MVNVVKIGYSMGFLQIYRELCGIGITHVIDIFMEKLKAENIVNDPPAR